MSKTFLGATVLALGLSATAVSAHDAHQLRDELQARGYYSIRFLVPEAPFQVNACRGETRFHLHADWYGRITERVAMGPCKLRWRSGDEDQEGYQWRRSDRRGYDNFPYRPYR